MEDGKWKMALNSATAPSIPSSIIARLISIINPLSSILVVAQAGRVKFLAPPASAP
jgi:hypothetical protein